jgi:arylsulfatase A-like enzyme
MKKIVKALEKRLLREFMIILFAVIFGANIIGCGQESRKPNLLFIWTDEQNAKTMQVYGNDKIHAPNLNKLASESVVFKNAYVSQPVCTPSRATVMTGLWPHQSTLVTNNIPLPQNVKCLPEIVNDLDYITGYFGKWHLGDEVFAQHGFQEWESIEDHYRKYYGPDRDRNQMSGYWHFLRDLGYTPRHTDNEFNRDFAASLPIDHCKPKFLELKTIDFLKRHKNDPFILYINFLEPHMPFFGPLNDEHDPSEIDLPPNFNDPLEDDEPLGYRLRREQLRKNGREGFPLKTEDDWRRLIANYWGLVTQVDRSVGAILNTLEDLGLADNTIVVYTSDHGDMMGAHRFVGKGVMYEEAVKVPWLMRIPQIGRRQHLIENRVSHIDLVPTILDLMNTNTDQSLPGQSLVPLINGKPIEEDHVFIQWNYFSDVEKPTDDAKSTQNTYFRTVISPDGWKLNLSDNDKSQLFNLNKDPYETTNLFYSGLYQDVIKRLTAKIHIWQEKVGDKVKI